MTPAHGRMAPKVNISITDIPSCASEKILSISRLTRKNNHRTPSFYSIFQSYDSLIQVHIHSYVWSFEYAWLRE